MSTVRTLALAAAGLTLSFVAGAQAATLTWTGAADTDFATAGNWTTDTASVTVPRNNDYQDIAKFTGAVPANEPNLAAGRAIFRFTFESAGWDVTGSQITLKEIGSSGAGTNTINSVKTGPNSYTWTIADENRLVINSIYHDNSNQTLTLEGGGTVYFASRIGGWSNSNTIAIKDVVVEINSSTPHSNGNKISLQDDASVFRLKALPSAIDTLIANSKIIDATGKGLTVTPMTGAYDGWTEVAVSVPEPATAAVFGMGSMLLLAVRRRRA